MVTATALCLLTSAEELLSWSGSIYVGVCSKAGILQLGSGQGQAPAENIQHLPGVPAHIGPHI